jgi:peptidyl-prolyl cis-trans isomerase C
VQAIRTVGQPVPASLSVGEAAITETAIAREMQYHPAPTPQQSRAAAARALVMCELLRREIERLELAAEIHPIGCEIAEEACIRALLERGVTDRDRARMTAVATTTGTENASVRLTASACATSY